MTLFVPIKNVVNPTSTVIRSTWIDVDHQPTPDVPAIMYFYSGFVPFDHGAGQNLTRNRVSSFVPLSGMTVQQYNPNLVKSITCAASLNVFAGDPDLAGVDDAKVQVRSYQLPGVAGDVNLLVLEADVAAQSGQALRLGYHITVLTLDEAVPPHHEIDGNLTP
jgi:hypothetical protein